MKDHVKTVKIGDEHLEKLDFLRRKHIGRNDSDRLRMGLDCLCDREDYEAEA